jgi:ribosomal protein S18 acetylase RimI-like enzyme
MHGLSVAELSIADEDQLVGLFGVLVTDPQTVEFFHPHPLTAEYALQLCRSQGVKKDRYYLTRRQGQLVGYSMLRGWDEGYDVPSFGGCVHPAARGTGVGHFLVIHAIGAAYALGARKLRLSLYKANLRALHIYTKVGFAFSAKNERELIGWLDLSTKTCPGLARQAG